MTNPIAREDVERLIEGAVPEGLTLEYKAAPYGNNDAAKKELLKDVSAFANTQGGLLLIGIVEKAGVAKSLTPLAAEATESARERIQQILKDGLEPRLFGVGVDSVAVEGGGLIALRVPRSLVGPHRVIYGGHGKFYLRASSIVYEANTMDLRRLFSETADLRERALRLHERRLAEISERLTPAPLADEAMVVVNIVPAAAFHRSVVLDVREANEKDQRFRPMGAIGFSPRFVAEGFANIRAGSPSHGYTLVGRDGVVEAVRTGVVRRAENGDDIIAGKVIERDVVRAVHSASIGLQELGVSPPFEVVITLRGVRGAKVIGGPAWFAEDFEPIQRSDLLLPTATIEDVESVNSTALALKVAFDAMWNASGFAESPSYEGETWKELA